MGLTHIQTFDTGAGHRVQIDTDRDGGLAVVSSEGGVFLSRLVEDGTEQIVLGDIGYAQFRSGYVETLSDGRYAVFTTDHFGQGTGVRLQIFERDGSPATAIVNPAFEDNADHALSGYSVTATDSGGFAVTWNDISRSADVTTVAYSPFNGSSSYNGSASYDVRTRYFDSTGAALGASVVADDDVESLDGATASRRYGAQYVSDAETLVGGQVAIVSFDTRAVGSPGGGFHNENQLSLQISMPGNAGEPIKVDLTPFNQPGFLQYIERISNPNANIVALADGSLAVIWTEPSYVADGSVYGGYAFSGTDTIIRYFDAAGTALTDGAVLVHRSTDLGNISAYTWAEALPDGRIVIAYNDGIYGVSGNGQVDAMLAVVGPLGSSIEISRANPVAAINTQNYSVQDLAIRSDGSVDIVYNDAHALTGGGNFNHTIVDRFSLGIGFNGIVLAGTAGADDLSTGATIRNDQIAGLGGDDVVRGLSGNDEIFGNAGSDRLFGDAGNDELFGNEGDDILEGGTGADDLRGGDGLDSASYAGAASAVNINLATGAKAGADAAGDSYVSIEGVIGTAFGDRLTGDDAANRLEGLGGNDILTGGLGDDIYVVEAASDRIVEAAGAGTDTVIAAFSYTLSASLENLTLTGTATSGLGNAANNVIIGNDANNLLKGVDGADMLYGGAGIDTLFGGAGDDQVFGGDGNDRLYFDGGYDVLVGGTGNDIYFLTAGSNPFVNEAIGGGTDTVRSAINFYAYSGSEIENILLTGAATTAYGNEFANRITGNAIGNYLVGYDGDDVLRVEGGGDTLVGGAGADTLIGGFAKDVLRGDGGADMFQFFAGDSTPGRTNADIVQDFTQADGDRLNLFQIDAIEGTPANDRFTFIGADAFHNVAGEVRYVQDGGNTYVSGDTDGNGVLDFTITLNGTITLVATDFVL